MLLAVKIISALFALLGVTELGTQVKYHKSSITVVRDLSVELFQKFNDHFFQKRGPAFAHVDDEVEHRQSWNYQDKEHDDDRRQQFHEAMQYKMKEVKSCHKACGWDVGCHKACPKPWAKFQEKCEMFKPILDCHKECHHSHSCHAQCPKPKCPRMAAKMEETMQCHQKCGHGDHTCHHACPRPMAHIKSKCAAMQDIMGCHEKCTPGDHMCHHACPKMWSLWHLHGKGHDNAQRFHHDHHHDHSPEEHDEVEHRQRWNYHGEEHGDDHHQHFDEAMQLKMKEVKSCHMTCGWDRACHKACPKPWEQFQEKCDMLKPIWECHKECHHSHGSHSCHAQCPKPQCPKLVGKMEDKMQCSWRATKLARKMEETMQCHQKCGDGDHTCHHACPRPMAHIKSKCAAMQDITECHGKCTPGDHMCYHACPNMWSLYNMHDNAQSFHHDDHHDHSPEADDEARHQKWWGYNGKEHKVDHRSNFHEAMGVKMHEVKECHKKCGWDLACHKSCPKPWKHFQEKCEKLKPIYECHKQCHAMPNANGDPQSCHAQCPVPKCPKMAEKLLSSLKCHLKCGNHKIVNFLSHKCRAACPHTMVHIEQRCDALQHITGCHQKCGPMDLECHGSCMKMKDLWHLGGGQPLVTVRV